jgi:hypothetical protein
MCSPGIAIVDDIIEGVDLTNHRKVKAKVICSKNNPPNYVIHLARKTYEYNLFSRCEKII